ncbi:MAG TPA: hypothetical protein VNA25_14540, partial [Phycisphaerae bacterium]|nr:hypothetical protein [Phycisphaerae bacterium]
MARIVLTFTMIVAAFHFLIPRLGDFFGIAPWRFIGLSMYLPAVILGTRSWWKTRSFARSWPAVLCVLIAWVGLLYAGKTESNRGVLIAAYLTMVLPVAALIVENRCWWHCVRVYVVASVAALALVIWFECRTHAGAMHLSLIRFGLLVSEDQSRYTANPNQVGGQLAFVAVLGFMLYLRREAARLRQASTPPRQDAFGLAGVVFLSLGCILTASRGAFVSWFGGMALLLFYGTGRIAPSKFKDLVALF